VRGEIGPHGGDDAAAALGGLCGVRECGDEGVAFLRVTAESEHFLELVHDDDEFGGRIRRTGQDLPGREV
jgi:hypothetical protein